MTDLQILEHQILISGKHFSGPDAIKLIKQYLKLSESREQEWVSVEEELPEDECECLTGNLFNASFPPRKSIFHVKVLNFKKPHFFLDNLGYDNIVTHWMPLPPVPKQPK